MCIRDSDQDKPIEDPVSKNQVDTLAKNAAEFGLTHYGMMDERNGINSLVMIDPVLGDNGKLYTNFDEQMCIRDRRPPAANNGSIISEKNTISPSRRRKYFITVFHRLRLMG